MKYKYTVLFGENGFIKFYNTTTKQILSFSGIVKLMASHPEIVSTSKSEEIKNNSGGLVKMIYHSSDIDFYSDENFD